MAKDAEKPQSATANYSERMIFQGWVSIALWMSVGLLLEGLLGYKIPAYLSDPQRRELFRLAHTHGTFLGLVLVAAALCAKAIWQQPAANCANGFAGRLDSNACWVLAGGHLAPGRRPRPGYLDSSACRSYAYLRRYCYSSHLFQKKSLKDFTRKYSAILKISISINHKR